MSANLESGMSLLTSNLMQGFQHIGFQTHLLQGERCRFAAIVVVPIHMQNLFQESSLSVSERHDQYNLSSFAI